MASKSEEKLKREKSELQAQLEELSKTKEDIVSVHIQQLNVRVSELESELEKAHRVRLPFSWLCTYTSHLFLAAVAGKRDRD